MTLRTTMFYMVSDVGSPVWAKSEIQSPSTDPGLGLTLHVATYSIAPVRGTAQSVPLYFPALIEASATR